jgi:hypothetical protein
MNFKHLLATLLTAVTFTAQAADRIIQAPSANGNIVFKNAAGTTTATLSSTGNLTTTGNVVQNSSAMFRNRIINGNFDIWQRGTSVSSGFLADRWISGNTTSYAQSTDVPNDTFKYSAKIDSNLNYPWFIQRIEAANARSLAGKSCTLSFWAKATGTMNLYVELVVPVTTEDTFGTYPSGSGIAMATFEFSSAPSSSWTYYSKTFSCTTAVKRGLQVGIVRSGSGSTTTYVTGIQLEEGSVATPFEFRPYGTELALCQRYFYREGAIAALATQSCAMQTTAVATSIDFVIKVPVTMRASPSLAFGGVRGTDWVLVYATDNTTNTTGTFVPVGRSVDSPEFDFSTGTFVAGGRYYIRYQTTSGYLGVSAEL